MTPTPQLGHLEFQPPTQNSEEPNSGEIRIVERKKTNKCCCFIIWQESAKVFHPIRNEMCKTQRDKTAGIHRHEDFWREYD